MSQPFTWKQLVADTLKELGGEASLRDITAKLKSNPNRPQTNTWDATVRRVVRQYKIFEPFTTAKGLAGYRLSELPKLVKGTSAPDSNVPDSDLHGHHQGMLLQLGVLCGYETFTNSTDKTIRKFKGEPLSKFATVKNDSEALKALPLGKMRTADVLWMDEDSEGLYPRYAFAVEHSTKVKDGLLRLLKIPGRYQTELYVIGQSGKEAKLFEGYLKVSPFREHAHRFHFFQYADVTSFFINGMMFDESVRQWKIEPAR